MPSPRYLATPLLTLPTSRIVNAWSNSLWWVHVYQTCESFAITKHYVIRLLQV